jgi:cytoskeleton protein RodZ
MSEAESQVTQLPVNPGASLKSAREARGLTPQQAAEQLTLDVSVVTALEANDFAALGAPVFAKGHLKRYAALMDLSADELLGAYQRSSDQAPPPVQPQRARATMIPARNRAGWPWVLGGTLAFLLAVGVAAYLSANGPALPGFRDVAIPSTGSGVRILAQPGPEAAAAGAALRARPGQTVGTDGVATAAPGASSVTLAAGQVSLQLRFAADSWAEVYDGDGKSVLYDLGRAGTQRTVTAAAPLSVTIGNANAVSISVNGRRVAIVAPPAGQTVARFSVTADGALR